MYGGKFALKNLLGSLIVGRKLPFLLCFTLYLIAISKYKPSGAHIRGGGGAIKRRGFCVTILRGLLEGLIFGFLRYCRASLDIIT